jgi:hypothetical protein
MTGNQLIKDNPYFFESQLDQFDAWDAVFQQAIEHNKRLKESALLKEQRPNEPDPVYKYRNATVGLISSTPVHTFKTKVPRIFKSSGLSINEQSLSQKLKDNLDSKPYYYLSRRTDLMTYVFDCFFSESIVDANGLWLDIPYNSENPTEAPAVSLPANKGISLKTVMIPYKDVKYVHSEVFAFKGGKKAIKSNDGKATTMLDYFWVVDTENWYSYNPVRYDTKTGKVVYSLDLWYKHDIGFGDDKELPINYNIGLLSKTIEGHSYQESLLYAYYSFADEFKQRFSDGKGNWVQHNYPVVVMREIPCPECDGQQKIKVGNGEWEDCKACNKTGKMVKPHQYGVIIEPSGGGMDEGSRGDAYKLITPPTQLLQTTYDIPFNLLDKGKKELGLDVLESVAESGTAKGLRLQPLKDLLHLISDKIVDAVEAHLWHRECYLEPIRSKRKRPSLSRPVDFDLKTTTDLKEEAETALTSDKLQSAIRYSDRLYKNDANLRRSLTLMYQWVPSILEDWQTVKDQLNGSIIDNDEVTKRNNAQWIFIELSRTPGFEGWTDERVFEEADNIMLERGLIIPPEQKAEEGSATRSKLLDTVGGVTGILQVAQSVALGEIGEAEGVNILVEVFGFTREKADSFISANSVKATEQITQPTNNGKANPFRPA